MSTSNWFNKEFFVELLLDVQSNLEDLRYSDDVNEDIKFIELDIELLLQAIKETHL